MERVVNLRWQLAMHPLLGEVMELTVLKALLSETAYVTLIMMLALPLPPGSGL